MLSVSPDNPRYLADGTGAIVVLTGSNYWNLWQDGGRTDPPPAFDFDAFLSFAVAHGYNAIHGHFWESPQHTTDSQAWYFDRVYWARTGPGNAADGHLKFDLTQYDATLFARLRARIQAAGELGLYAVFPVFNSFSLDSRGNISAPWTYHPMNSANNINSINGDPTSQGHGFDCQTLNIAAVTTAQEALIEHLIDTLGDLPNIVWEIAIEPDGTYTRAGHDTFEWCSHFVDYIHTYEATKTYQHPVLYSTMWPGADNGTILASNADIISPNPAYTGTTAMVQFDDTDHLDWPNGSATEFWQWFTRGAGGCFFMDQSYSTYDDQDGEAGGDYASNENARDNLGAIAAYAARVGLVDMVPQDGGSSPCSTGYCLHGGHQYLVYNDSASNLTLDLSGESGTFQVERYNLGTLATSDTTTTGGASRTIALPGGWSGAWAAWVRP